MDKNTFYFADQLSDTINNYWELLILAMDDTIREKVHLELAPCTNQEFLDRYMELATEDLIIGDENDKILQNGQHRTGYTITTR